MRIPLHSGEFGRAGTTVRYRYQPWNGAVNGRFQRLPTVGTPEASTDDGLEGGVFLLAVIHRLHLK
jgi:hypothetical protein